MADNPVPRPSRMPATLATAFRGGAARLPPAC